MIAGRGGERGFEANHALSFLERMKIRFPFHGQTLSLFGVAGFTGGNNVSFGASATPCDGHDMVHCQFSRGNRFAAVMTDAFGQAAFPPLRGPQISGLLPLPADIAFLKTVGERVGWVFSLHWSPWGCTWSVIGSRDERTIVTNCDSLIYS